MANPLSIYEIAGRAMSAQLVRLNTTASNLANAGAVSSTTSARRKRSLIGGESGNVRVSPRATTQWPAYGREKRCSR